MAKVDIGDLTLLEAFEALWVHYVPNNEFQAKLLLFDESKFDCKEASAALENNSSIDYWHGRAIKTKFEGNHLDPVQYDRNTYPGAMEEIIYSARALKAANALDEYFKDQTAVKQHGPFGKKH